MIKNINQILFFFKKLIFIQIVHITKINYTHYDVYLSEERQAFYTTSRHQNYSNGIYNQMFASGVDSSRFPNHSSRVWWSQINNPLYFPDTNYLEVGSNDTSVMGLTKVGDYLAAVKQSKTTDTAIYLLFPTSFEDNTTFAVKQGVQGVGALAGLDARSIFWATKHCSFLQRE